MTKKVIIDLFGGLNNSIKKALDLDKYEVLTYDYEKQSKCGEFENNFIDMTWDYNVIWAIFEHLKGKVDILLASPPCNSFSTARRYKDGGTGGWVINNDGSLSIRSYESWLENRSADRHDIYDGVPMRAIMGKKMVENTIRLIKDLGVKDWIIENPKNSLIWRYIENNRQEKGYKNYVYYGNYGFPAPKATIFFSNMKLDLDYSTKYKESTTTGIDNMKREDRSDIPKELIQTIFKQWEDKQND